MNNFFFRFMLLMKILFIIGRARQTQSSACLWQVKNQGWPVKKIFYFC
jgi:hypothetical protein